MEEVIDGVKYQCIGPLSQFGKEGTLVDIEGEVVFKIS